jgi:hypothetical protein
MLKKPIIRLAVLGLMLLGSALAFYLISPLFVRATFGEDAWPTLGYMPTLTPKPATQTLAPTQTETPQTVMSQIDLTRLLEGDTSLILAQGDFYTVTHDGGGVAKFYQVEELGIVLRLEEFLVENGPELHVYLTSADPVENTTGVDLSDAVDLGELKALSGDQTYEVPADLDLTSYQSVVIWCVPYKIPFIAAPIQSPQ